MFSAALAAGLLAALCAGCLGGDGDDGDDSDAGPGDAGETEPQSACAMAMLEAPTGAAATPLGDTLATATRNTWDNATVPTEGAPDYPGGKYRTLTADGDGAIHPGCSTEGLLYTPADIAGYPCAAREYPFPDGVAEDTDKPIVLLIHGNSDSPVGFESYVHPDPKSLDFPADTAARDQLAERLPAAGYRTIAADFRIDRVDDPKNNLETENAALNIDHGWAVPIAQALIKQVIENNPDREISIVGFSLGATVVRDALRRLFVENQDGVWNINVYGRVRDAIIASGANHGFSSNALCGNNLTMRGTVTCEMGDRGLYTQTAFHEALNGPAMPDTGDGAVGYWYETPCADGSYAFGVRDACDGNAVQWTSITMADIEQGTYQDLFVSEHASRLYPVECANNIVNDLNDFDTSGYFLNGLFRNHYGSVRSATGLDRVLAALAD
ncbi:MAG: hypothetical protein AAGC55_05200 [Myxococcota bacterium]